MLELSHAKISWSAGTLSVDCQVLLVNRTGATLTVLTNFASPFDGFTVIVRGPYGGLVARQSYVAHQSPYAMNRALPVPPGVTEATLRFPIPLAKKPVRPLEVQLTGGLRGTRFSRSIRSNTLAVH